MKVLFLTNIPSPYRVDFFNELGKFCDLTVLYELRYASDRDKEWKGNRAKNFKQVFLNGKRIGSDSSISFSIFKYLKDNSYDLIVIGGYSTPTGMMSIFYLNKIKRDFILNCDGGFIKKDSKIKYLIKKYFIKSAKWWLSTGKETTKYLINYGADKNRIRVYPFTSISEKDLVIKMIDESEKRSIKNQLGINEKKIIISVGQFIYRKGYDVLLKSCKDISKDVGVYIIGGNINEEYRKLKDEYNLDNVHFLGFKNKEELKKYYKISDLFVLPTREDIWGLVVNEAMAFGLPVITTKKCIAGLELISDKELLIESENYNELRIAIENVLFNENLINAIKKKNMKKIEEYTIEKMAKSHIEIFEEIKNDCKYK
ncbi:glycosyltransferase family 4 protein [Clostridium perfringens]|uniref:glycosyltransferase family 4 protein n=1 Tax=Clostridium perfringens TaxID=1502 RepID=UPI0018E493F2|nr:glycosyltransferase family 4 protein [Clostridium perfringens]EIF6174294.1 glycosyltransferase family 4 protein [Clostridium perfringens]MBI6047910.1 glycosyltransferase family 4 protein [Clostridium perfringens]MDM0806580.1 glycosyltransferase family 4 protein [Clostridium perfringens]